jgi:ribA/ribD-fused uncharacterized protein
MDKTSYFIKDKALFGSYPTQDGINELENNGVRYFVNLTYDTERKIVPYTTNYTMIRYPIKDRSIPTDWNSFTKFILHVCNIIKNLKKDEKLLVNCKGGHGRSGTVVACIICYLYSITPSEALNWTKISHSKRLTMRDKWRKLGAPQTLGQKNFVHKFFQPLYFYRAYMSGYMGGFSNFTNHKVKYNGLVFPTSEAAIQAYKNPLDKHYLDLQVKATSPIISKNLGRKVKIRDDWLEICVDIMYDILLNKFKQNKYLIPILTNTGLRPIVQHTRSDGFWGDGLRGDGKNKLGKCLDKLRMYFYENG